jgi:hypothetical protein
MSRVTSVSLLLAIGFCLYVSGGLAAQTLPSQKDLNSCPESPQSPFRYVITRSDITEGTHYPQGGKFRARGVDVLLAEKSFSESTLKQVFALISKRFPGPAELYVSVYTSLDDMLTPEEGEFVVTNCTLNFAKLKFPSAFYTRDGEREQFVYRSRGDDGFFEKTVVLRGKE